MNFFLMHHNFLRYQKYFSSLQIANKTNGWYNKTHYNAKNFII